MLTEGIFIKAIPSSKDPPSPIMMSKQLQDIKCDPSIMTTHKGTCTVAEGIENKGLFASQFTLIPLISEMLILSAFNKKHKGLAGTCLCVLVKMTQPLSQRYCFVHLIINKAVMSDSPTHPHILSSG